MANNRLFVVKFRIGNNDFHISKAFAGRLSAQQYVESKVKDLLKDKYDPDGGCWIDAWNYRYEDALRCETSKGEERIYDYSFEIEEVDVEQNVVLPELPFVEKESLALKQENKDLRKKLGHTEGLIAAAKCHLVMYDGAIYTRRRRTRQPEDNGNVRELARAQETRRKSELIFFQGAMS